MISTKFTVYGNFNPWFIINHFTFLRQLRDHAICDCFFIGLSLRIQSTTNCLLDFVYTRFKILQPSLEVTFRSKRKKKKRNLNGGLQEGFKQVSISVEMFACRCFCPREKKKLERLNTEKIVQISPTYFFNEGLLYLCSLLKVIGLIAEKRHRVNFFFPIFFLLFLEKMCGETYKAAKKTVKIKKKIKRFFTSPMNFVVRETY